MSNTHADTSSERIPMSSLVPVIKEVISSGGEFNLFTRGTSMKPTIVEGVHSVMLGAPTEIARGDIILYERANGQFVLHRLLKIKGDEYFTCGDNQYIIERGIHPDSVIARVTKIQKGDTSVDVDKSRAFLFALCIKRIAKRTRSSLGRAARRFIKNK